MLAKLLKYDFKAGAQIMSIMIIFMAALLGANYVVSLFEVNLLSQLLLLASIVATIGVIGVFVVTRTIYFYNTTVGKECYFTYSIPTGVGNIVFSKIFTSFVWGVITLGAAVGFWVVYAKFYVIDVDFSALTDTVGWLIIIAVLGQFLFAMVTLAFSISLSAYTKFRNRNFGIITSIIAYIVIYNVFGVIQLAILAVTQMSSGRLTQIINNTIPPEQTVDFMNELMIPIAIVYVVFSVLFYILTVSVLKKHKSI